MVGNTLGEESFSRSHNLKLALGPRGARGPGRGMRHGRAVGAGGGRRARGSWLKHSTSSRLPDINEDSLAGHATTSRGGSPGYFDLGGGGVHSGRRLLSSLLRGDHGLQCHHGRRAMIYAVGRAAVDVSLRSLQELGGGFAKGGA